MTLKVDPSNPNSIEYYLVFIFFLVIAYFSIILITYITKLKYNNNGVHMHIKFSEDLKSLRYKYLIVNTIIRSSIWVKAPYVFALYNRLHGFTRGDIGLLYAIDNLSSLIMGPTLGSLGDIYGRKKFCVLYCVIVVIQITMRLTGNIYLAFLAQILTGMSGALIETVFESWLNFEASALFSLNKFGSNEKNYYLKDIFSKQVNIDCYTSIILTGIGSFIYLKYGITIPFYISIFFAAIAAVLIVFYWKENVIEKVSESNKYHLKNNNQSALSDSIWHKLKFSWDCLRTENSLLCVGIIESCFKISLQLFIFIWTPLLEETTGGYIHPGSVFICFMICRLTGSQLFELFKMILHINSFNITLFITVTAMISFLVDYEVSIFNVRFFMFVYFDGLSGIFNPLISSLKSHMIPENIRTTVMTFFRIPTNSFAILSLILTNYVTTYQICIVAFCFLFIGSIVNVYLISQFYPPDSINYRHSVLENLIISTK